MHTARILEVRLAWTPSLGQGADIGENDDGGTIVVDATVACCGFLPRWREMCVLGTLRGGRGETGGRLSGRLGRGKLEDGLCGANKVDGSSGNRCLRLL